ncbi:NUDIX hydrolase [Novosphingobium sp. 9U]|uniref:NUDIX hydrolase n=1 Tax=Novosphingobium sp. 9U TaxID=2653158 RepID=UPI0012F259EF|nr:NUDIX domain-containing protein [Novosphingobium sp. 9U]VWX51648.1 ADP-ribose pyrophosphatase [Novosphingobium sp. 9U]
MDGSVSAGEVVRVARPAARIVLQDEAGRVLLFRFDPADRPPFWCTPGGAVDPGESYEDAARRELREETGIVAEPGEQIARKTAEFLTLEGVPVIADERYFRVTLPPGAAIDTGGHTDLERSVMRSWRWFDRAELAALDELWYPEDLVDLLA